MIDIHRFPQQLEIIFWSAMIEMMKKAPEQCRVFLQIREYVRSPRFFGFLNRALFWSLVGLILGFSLGFASRLVL